MEILAVFVVIVLVVGTYFGKRRLISSNPFLANAAFTALPWMKQVSLSS
jgi:hypothetical protein